MTPLVALCCTEPFQSELKAVSWSRLQTYGSKAQSST